MSDFDLVPVDGGDPIHLPPGETVVGRGPLLRVNDKRVSRNHGLLENLNGELRLKPTHVNPCFVQSSLTDDPRPLQRDSWCPLHHGDLFSLLPGQYIYKVVAVGGEDQTPRNSQMIEEEEEEGEEEGPPVSQKPDVEPPPPIRQDSGQTPPDEEPTAAALSNQDDTHSPDRSLNKGDCAQPREMEDDQSGVTPSEPKRRVLPAWMMVAAAPPSSSSSPKAVKRSKGAAAASTSTKRTADKPAKASSPEEAELSEEEMPKKRRKMHVGGEEEEKAAPSKTVECNSERVNVPSERPTVRPQTESNRSEVSDESDSFTMEVEEEERGGGTSKAQINTMTQPYESTQPENEDKKLKNGRQTTQRAESGSVPGAAALRPNLRTPCPYGKDCYRKNPIHFQECSHPGDTDYEEEDEEEEETEEADRPECPYGTDCYRKNPLHRKEYKHTKRPAYTTRTIPKKTPADDEDEDEDLEDDSFINDDSEDVGDDSDYIPPDSDDSGKEDIKRLQKEAKAFVKRRK
ncbi:Aprataxin and PNK-like factor [Collichthys lucidus]|uniref:Aprataxin and PNK-like factor n=1 Tax=Collichthys lucidus TaxID=240159 RepID=A0A4U5U3P2_COLLU|nr:Aprataxin and PNK-like factor [Collichthys lucidus]